MSLYGNIKRIGSSTFQFDRIYNSRKEMDEALKNGDGVYNGRYVLIEYGERYSTEVSDGQSRVENADYIANRQNDLNTYHNVYDSTVWQKIYITQDNTSAGNVNAPTKLHEKYIMVAELNAMIPQMELQEYDTATLIKTQEDQTEMPDLYVGENNEQLHDVFDIKPNTPYFDEIQDTELNYILHMPKPMELDVTNDVEYHKEKFNIYQSYPDISSNGGNFIGWKPVVDPDALVDDLEGGKAIKQSTPFSKYELNMYLPAFGDVLGMLYDTLFGTAITNGGIRPYFFNNGIYDISQLENIDLTVLDDEHTNISKILANNSEGLAGVLSALFADKTVPGDIRYYLSADWLAKNTDEKTNVPGILNKPKVVFDESKSKNDIYNRNYYIDYYNWSLNNIFTDKLELKEVKSRGGNSENIAVSFNGNDISIAIINTLTSNSNGDIVGKWISIECVYTETPYPMHKIDFSNISQAQESNIKVSPRKTSVYIDLNCDDNGGWQVGDTINFVVTTESPSISAISTINFVGTI